MKGPAHVFVTYIRTTPEKLWEALVNPDFTQRYFHATRVAVGAAAGEPFAHLYADGRTAVDGEVLEIEAGKRLSVSWHVLYDEEQSRERPSRVTYEIERVGENQCKLTVVHDRFEAETKTWRSVGEGWPWILDSLKSLLETGQPLPYPEV
jgi:uncharacterized protein YndB with AHSA1/START domain